MPRYVAFLRGVMPTNVKMPALKHCFESAGFTDVKTVLGSGNVVFSANGGSESAIESRIETAMEAELGRVFHAIVRNSVALRELIKADPYERFSVPVNAKQVVTFVRKPPEHKPLLPLVSEGVHLLAVQGREIFSAYLPNPKGPVFMEIIEKNFGKDVTTRTWDTVRKCAGV